MEEETQLGKSLMNIRKRSRPKTEPCGTPDTTSVRDELLPFQVIYCERLVRKHSSQVNKLGSRFNEESLSISNL